MPAGISSVKLVTIDSLHVTGRFLGLLSQAQIDSAGRSLQEAASHCAPFRLAIDGIGAFPNTRRPRTIWAGVTRGAQELKHLRQAFDTALAAHGFPGATEEAFVGHITLARVRSPIPREDWPRISQAIADANESSGEPVEFIVDRLTLMESRLFATSSAYRPLFSGILGNR